MGKRKNRTFCSRALAYILCFLIVLQASPIAYAAELGSPSPQDAAGPVAAIGGNTYEDLASAFAAAEDGQKIELKRDADVSSTIQVAKSVTFDLGGHTVNANVGYPGVFQFATAGVEATFTNGNIMNTGSGAGIAGKAEFSLVLDGVDFTMGSGNAVSLTGRPCANATAEIKSGTFTSRHQYPLSGYDNETFTLAEGVKIVSSIDGMSPVSYCGNDKTAILPDGCYANVEVSDSGVTCTITKGIAPMVKGSKGYYHTVGEAAAAGETSISLIGTVGSPDSFVADSVIPAGTSVSLLIPAQDGEQVYYGNIEVQGSLTVNTYTSDGGILGDLSVKDSGTILVKTSGKFKTDIRQWLDKNYGATQDDDGLWIVGNATIQGNSGTKYATINMAITAGEREITLLANHMDNAVIDIADPITINLGGFILSGGVTGKCAAVTVGKNANVTIKGSGTITSSRNYFKAEEYAIENQGTLTLKDLTITGVDAPAHVSGGPASDISRNALVRSNGQLTMEKCHLSNTLMLAPNGAGDGTECDGGLGVLVYGGEATIDNTYIYAGYNGVYASAGHVSIKGKDTNIQWAGNSLLAPEESGRHVDAVDAVSTDMVTITGGKYNSNVSRYVPSGYAAKGGAEAGNSCEVVQVNENNASEVVASSVRIIFLDDVHTSDGKQYQIVAESADAGTTLYAFKSASLGFELTGSDTLSYTVAPAAGMTVDGPADDIYTFKCDAGISGNRVVLGLVQFSGFGEGTFGCKTGVEGTQVVTGTFGQLEDSTYTEQGEPHALVLNQTGVTSKEDNITVYGTIPVSIDHDACTVTLDLAGGSLSGDDVTLWQELTKTVEYDSSLELPTPQREGYQFAGWVDGKGSEVSSPVQVLDDLNLTAQWQKVIKAGETLTANGVTITATESDILYDTNEDGTITLKNGPADVVFTGDTVIHVGFGGQDVKVTGEAGAEVSIDANGGVTAKDGTSLNGDTASGYLAIILYTVHIVPSANGSVTAEPASAVAGASVDLTVSPSAGYELSELKVTDGESQPVDVEQSGAGYRFTMPKSDVTVSASFTAISAPHYDVTIPDSFQNGKVIASADDAAAGAQVTLTVDPDDGYELDSLTVTDSSGKPVELTEQGSGVYTFKMPEGGVSVSASFKESVAEQYQIELPKSTEHGTVTASHKTAAAGDTVTLTVVPDSGYELYSLKVTGSSNASISYKELSSGKYSFTMPASDVKVTAVFAQSEKETYLVKVSSSKNGTVSASAGKAEAEELVFVTVKPATGYQLKELKVSMANGKTVETRKIDDGSYVFTMPASDVIVSASFEKSTVEDDTYEVKILDAQNGSVTADPAKAEKGKEVSLTIKPDAGYELKSLRIVNGKNEDVSFQKSEDDRYVFTMPASDVTVTAVFSKIQAATYDIAIAEPDNGVVTANVTRAAAGEKIVLTAKAAYGYRLDTIKVRDPRGRNIELKKASDGTYSFEMPASVVFVISTFAVDAECYDITVTQPWHGSVETDPTRAASGDRVDLAIKPDKGYVLSSLVITDKQGNIIPVRIDKDGSCYFIMPDAEVVIRAAMVKESTQYYYRVVTDNTKHGVINAYPQYAAAGEKVLLEAIPDKGYGIRQLKIVGANGGTVFAKENLDGTYTFLMPASNVFVTAQFVEIESEEDDKGKTGAYDITLDNIQKGTVTSDHKSADAGVTVTLTVKPDDGYELLGLFIVDKKDVRTEVKADKDGKYTFEMPKSDITVTASFAKKTVSLPPEIVETPDVETQLPIVEPTPVPSTPVYSHPFMDVPANSWYNSAVSELYAKGIMKGTSASLFSPNMTTTRGQLVTILYRMEGSPAVSSGKIFSDVAGGAYYTQAVLWASANGIVNGIGGNMFAPNRDVTREQITTILYRYAQYKGRSVQVNDQNVLSAFSDASGIANFARSAMQWACANGVMKGNGSGLLSPKSSCTRAEIATLISNYLTMVG